MNAVLGDLPTWNLADLYSSPTGTDLHADLKRAAEQADAFAVDYEGKIASLDGKVLGAAIARYEAMSELMGRIGSYAQLYYAQNMADAERGRFAQNVSENLTTISSKLVFFGLELKRLDEELIRELVWMKLAMVELEPAHRCGRQGHSEFFRHLTWRCPVIVIAAGDVSRCGGIPQPRRTILREGPLLEEELSARIVHKHMDRAVFQSEPMHLAAGPASNDDITAVHDIKKFFAHAVTGSCSSSRWIRPSLLITSTMCTGMRMVRAWSAMARVMAWRIHQVA